MKTTKRKILVKSTSRSGDALRGSKLSHLTQNSNTTGPWKAPTSITCVKCKVFLRNKLCIILVKRLGNRFFEGKAGQNYLCRDQDTTVGMTSYSSKGEELAEFKLTNKAS